MSAAGAVRRILTRGGARDVRETVEAAGIVTRPRRGTCDPSGCDPSDAARR
jgi:hypothetical protein